MRNEEELESLKDRLAEARYQLVAWMDIVPPVRIEALREEIEDVKNQIKSTLRDGMYYIQND